MAVLCLALTSQTFAQQNMATYVGNAGNERFNDLYRLSDNSVLVPGRVSNLDWLPTGTPVTTLTIPQLPSNSNPDVMGINSFDNDNIGVILHLSADMQTILNVVRFPSGTVGDVTRIKSNNVPGQPVTGLWISGRRNNASPPPGFTGDRGDGYYIAKLNNNFIGGVPTGLEWSLDVRSQQRRSNQGTGPYPAGGGESDVKRFQPWDVAPNGKIYYVSGREFSDDWCQMHRRTADGLKDDTVGGFSLHWVQLKGTPDVAPRVTEVRGRHISQIPDSITVNVGSGANPNFVKLAVDSVRDSGIILKMNRNGSNYRSHNEDDFNFVTTDENGNPGRKGKYPDDLFYANPCLDGTCNNAGPGYTGVSLQLHGNNTANQLVKSITVDKRTGEVYFGVSTWSQVPGNNRDFDPALVAMSPNGEIKWWRRLYKEDTIRSTSWQFVDQVEIDYTNNNVVVLARTIHNRPNNFWKGNELIASPGANGFQNEFTGAITEDIDIRWIAKYRLADGVILRSTYVGEAAINGTSGTPFANPLMDGWNDPNTGNPNLANTLINKMVVDSLGNVLVVGSSDGRVITTSNAFQKMLKPALGSATDSLPANTSFVRVYSNDLSQVTYSSLLTGIWDPKTGSQGGNIELWGVLPAVGGQGLQVAGWHRNGVDAMANQPMGPQIPTINMPAYGTARPEGASGILASLNYTLTEPQLIAPDSIFGPSAACAGSSITYRVRPVQGAVKYVWALPNSNFSGYSEADTINVTSSPGLGGTLRVVAVNASGATTMAALVVDAPGVTARPTAVSLPSPFCAGATITLRATVPNNGFNSLLWKMPSRGYVPQGAVSVGDSLWLTTSDTLVVTINDTTIRGGALGVYADGTCGRSAIFSRNLANPSRFPTRADSIRRPTGTNEVQCLGTSRLYTASGVTGAQRFIWTLPGANWSATNLTTTSNSITIRAEAAGPGGVITVRAQNACGDGPVTTLNVPAVGEPPVMGSINNNTIDRLLTITSQPNATYQWLLGTQPIAGATDTSLNYSNRPSGNYSVRVTTPCGTITMGPVAVVGLAQALQAGQVKFYPNPVEGELFVELGAVLKNGTYQVNVADILGRKVKQTQLLKTEGEQTYSISMDGMKQGVYIIEITDGTQRILHKVTRK